MVMYHSKVQKGVEDCAYRMPAMKGNSFTFLQDISRHSKNINGRQRIVDRRIWRKKIHIYMKFTVANCGSPFSIFALQSIQRFFCMNLAYKTSFNCIKCMQRQE